MASGDPREAIFTHCRTKADIFHYLASVCRRGEKRSRNPGKKEAFREVSEACEKMARAETNIIVSMMGMK